MLWHDNVDNQQKSLIRSQSGIKDETIKLQLTDAIQRQVDGLQQSIELDSTLSGNEKIKYLRSLDFLLQGYSRNKGKRDFPVTLAPGMLTAFEKCMRLDVEHKSILPVIEAATYGIGKLLVESLRYSQDNPGMTASEQEVFLKYCTLHPDEILPELRKNQHYPFTDSLIKVAALHDINKVYDYAQAHNSLGNRIRSQQDSLVRLISRMASSKSGRLYFPFMDNLILGKISFEEIDAVKDNDLKYFRLMVKTRIDYAKRQLPPTRDTANGMKALTSMMANKAKQYFIREINALHVQENDNIRFRRLDGLTSQELYYLAVLGEDEIYTSSYTRGVYPRIMQNMGNPRGDSLIMSVHGDMFRKFIKMAAGYNTLDTFLSTMDRENAETLMKAFVIGLERKNRTHNSENSEEDDDLEDAVDVADSYSSIMDKNKELAAFILNEVKVNYLKNLQDNNRRGTVIYNILQILFESADTTKKVDLSKILGIPSVYNMDYASLKDDSGRVIQQVFFYGDEDKDGQNSFVNFMSMFRGRSEWRVDERNPEWVSIKSTRGKPVWIYANRPLFGEDDPDEKAQDDLMEYMSNEGLQPSVIIHRGHSYHLTSTLQKLSPSGKIVVLGSCGGYNNLKDVLNVCKDAHIISSKQVGTKVVNEPILQAINTTLVNGSDIDWISIWRELGNRFSSGNAKEKFDDYIPPYNNLGAIFIKAYRKAMGKD